MSAAPNAVTPETPRGGAEVHLPDAMSAWDGDGTCWLAVAHYSTRGKARAFYAAECGCDFTDVRVRARHARYAPESEANYDALTEFWAECEPDAPGAFPVWRCE